MTADAVASATLLPPRRDLSGARLRLFETALVLFGDRGYHAVSVRDLANAMGQQPGALYFHVPSKQQLLYELLHIGLTEHLACVKAAVLDAGREPVDQILSLIRAHVMWHLDYPSLARVVSRETRSLTGEQRQAMDLVRRESEQLCIDVLERGVRMGVFHTDEPYLAMKALAAAGIRAVEWWTPESGISVERIAEAYAQFAVKMVS